MKTVYKVLGFGMLLVAFAIAGVTPGFAQTDQEKQDREKAKTDAYTAFLACYKDTDKQKREVCYAGAKDYLDKYGTPVDEYVTFVKKKYDAYLASLEKEKEDALFTRFDNSIKDPKNPNVDEAFASGKEILAKKPDFVDVMLVLASLGFDQAAAKPPITKYNADAINYAKMAIQSLEANKPSATGNYGVYAYNYKSADPKIDSRTNAIGWMNYTIGYIMFYSQNQKKEALPYLYKATQINAGTKNLPEIYRTIGSWYVDEFIKLDNDRVAKIKAAGDKDTDETLALLALQKGYADRFIDAYARAYKVASNDPKDKAYKDSLLSRVKELYSTRFNKDMSGFDAYLAGVNNKSLVDPTTPVTPVVEAAPTTATAPVTGTTVTQTANTPAAPTTPKTMTAVTTTTKPGTTTVTTTTKVEAANTAASSTTKTKTTVKKPAAAAAPKKKGAH